MRGLYLLERYWKVDRVVRLNKDGMPIGYVLRNEGKKIYYSRRKKAHFYLKNLGFGIQKSILPKLFSWGISRVVIDYHGVRGRKLYVSHLGDWIDSGDKIDYVKDRDQMTLESYGQQKTLPVSEMREIILKP